MTGAAVCHQLCGKEGLHMCSHLPEGVFSEGTQRALAVQMLTSANHIFHNFLIIGFLLQGRNKPRLLFLKQSAQPTVKLSVSHM